MPKNNGTLGNSFNGGAPNDVQMRNVQANMIGLNYRNNLIEMKLEFCDSMIVPDTWDLERFLTAISDHDDKFFLDSTSVQKRVLDTKPAGTPIFISTAQILEPDDRIIQADPACIIVNYRAQNEIKQTQKTSTLKHATIRVNEENGIRISSSTNSKVIEGHICDLPAAHNHANIIKRYMNMPIVVSTYMPEDELLKNRYMGLELPEIIIERNFAGTLMASDPRPPSDFDKDAQYERIRQATLIASRAHTLS